MKHNLKLRVPHIAPLGGDAFRAAMAHWDCKTKPSGSLGQIEQYVARYRQIRSVTGRLPPDATPLELALVVMAADHGVAEEGVSAYPQQVTGQMLANFASGGAAINVLCRRVGARLRVVNVGALSEAPPPVQNRIIRRGSRNLLREEALSAEEVVAAFDVGLRLAEELDEAGVTLVGLGEMGIGNTTVAAALAAAFTGVEPGLMVGYGTGVDEQGYLRKKQVVEAALQRHRPDSADPQRVLEQLGGLEIIALAGLALGAAGKGIAVLLDGFISSVAGLIARALSPNVTQYCFASHASVEPGHRWVLCELDLSPMLNLGLRLGEGSGAALAMPLFTSGISLFDEMATFEGAGVSGRQT